MNQESFKKALELNEEINELKKNIELMEFVNSKNQIQKLPDFYRVVIQKHEYGSWSNLNKNSNDAQDYENPMVGKDYRISNIGRLYIYNRKRELERMLKEKLNEFDKLKA